MFSKYNAIITRTRINDTKHYQFQISVQTSSLKNNNLSSKTFPIHFDWYACLKLKYYLLETLAGSGSIEWIFQWGT